MDMQTWRDGRARAEDATKALREALAALGVPERVQEHLRPMVTRTGRPYVHVGTVRADHIEQIAEALRIAAAVGNPAARSERA
ncbi:hypothetical protein NLX86_21080 [Streptomyces sp. A3M-1-3]|uniref:hypothetical protein n=1 Tax=Streptomyces sp. A3M-1-3 TaxID=2962044 RepID=UPI0020B8B37E|nr:hypothetical protein [Streptomyces sp. A3M-1-3]MCP3820496.1 hypothetical protein [Streptomyces sp. A3M-1-3]